MPRLVEPVDTFLGQAVYRLKTVCAIAFQQVGLDQAAHGSLRCRESGLVRSFRKAADCDVNGSNDAKPICHQQGSQPDALL